MADQPINTTNTTMADQPITIMNTTMAGCLDAIGNSILPFLSQNPDLFLPFIMDISVFFPFLVSIHYGNKKF